MFKKIKLLLFVFIIHCLHAQNYSTRDSLSFLLTTTKEDTNKVNILNALAEEFKYTNPDTSIILSTQALSLAEKINFKIGIGKSEHNLGKFNYFKGNYPLSLDHFFKALTIWEKLEKFVSQSLSSTGVKPQILNRKSFTLNNIGNVYLHQLYYPKALDYYFKALKINKEIRDQNGIAINLGNIGNVYLHQSNYPKALGYYIEALQLNEELGDQNGIAINLGNIGIVYIEQEDYPKALDYCLKALKIYEELGDQNGIALNLGNIGSLYSTLNKYKEAEKYLRQALALSVTIGYLDVIRDVENSLSELYTKLGKHELAMEHYKKYIVARDTLYNQENTRKATLTGMQYEFEKEQIIKEQEALRYAQDEKERQRILAEKIIRRNNLQYTFIFLIILLVFGFVLMSGFIKTSQQLNQALIFISVLILFEFLLVLTDPFLDNITKGIPVYKLLANTLLALSIFPIHKFMEKRLKKRVKR